METDLVCDHVVVGSSPLMIMVAQQFQKKGARVVVVSKEDEFGGAWRSVPLSSGGFAEAACHLIEPIPDIYQIMEKFSGVAFEEQRPKPIRHLNQRVIIPYESFVNRILTLGALLAAATVSLLHLLRFAKDPLMEIKLQKASIATRNFSRYITGAGAVRAPACGYAVFAERLKSSAEGCGVKFVSGEVRHIDCASESLRVCLSDGEISCKFLESTSSARFELHGSRLIPSTGRPISRSGVFVSVCSSLIKREFSYVAFSGRAPLKRMFRLDSLTSSGGVTFVLFELSSGETWGSAKDSVTSYLIGADYFHVDASFDCIAERIEHIALAFATPHFLRSGDRRIRYWNSKGNLADGVYRYRKFLAV